MKEHREPASAQVKTEVPPVVAGAKPVVIERIKVHSAALEGNDQILLATFDLSPEVLTAIDAGTILFAIDQQQYLQGYLGVLIVTQYAQYNLLPGGGQPILTGPGFVDQETALTVQELSEQGIR